MIWTPCLALLPLAEYDFFGISLAIGFGIDALVLVCLALGIATWGAQGRVMSILLDALICMPWELIGLTNDERRPAMGFRMLAKVKSALSASLSLAHFHALTARCPLPPQSVRYVRVRGSFARRYREDVNWNWNKVAIVRNTRHHQQQHCNGHSSPPALHCKAHSDTPLLPLSHRYYG